MITKKLHTSLYFGFKIRNTKTNGYCNLDDLSGIAFLLVLPSGVKLVARKPFSAERDAAEIKKVTSEFYYCKFSVEKTAAEKEAGVGLFEIGTLAPDADISEFVSKSDPVRVRFTLPNLDDVL